MVYFKHSAVTLNQKALIRKLFDELGCEHPDFNLLNRNDAHKLIDNTVHDIYRIRRGLPLLPISYIFAPFDRDNPPELKQIDTV